MQRDMFEDDYKKGKTKEDEEAIDSENLEEVKGGLGLRLSKEGREPCPPGMHDLIKISEHRSVCSICGTTFNY